jgi:hypothetical protein
MQPSEQDAAYLWDMLDAAETAVRIVASRDLEAYLGDEMLLGGHRAKNRDYRRGGPESIRAVLPGAPRDSLADDHGSTARAGDVSGRI